MEEWRKKRERKREQGADTDLTIRGNPTNRMTGMKGRLICIFSLSLSLSFPLGRENWPGGGGGGGGGDIADQAGCAGRRLTLSDIQARLFL